MEGDYVKIITKDEEFEGTLMPSVKKGVVVLKLDNGYNMGFDKNKVKKIETIKPYKEKKIIKQNIPQNKKLPSISILHTGGTIASKVDYATGGVKMQFSPEELLTMFPEIRKIANINSRLMKNMWSQDMRFEHYNLIAKEIEEEIKKGAEGIIVTQGTDTIHYTSSALAFILGDLPIPVMVVGAQRSSDRGSSDAYHNVINAAYFMANSDFAEVGVCMHSSQSDDYAHILPGTKTRKFHTSRRDAFRPVNTLPWARVSYKEEKIEWLKKGYCKKSDSNLKLKLFKDVKVGIIKQRTNMFAEEFLFFKNYDGLVIEATGLGCLPITQIDESTKESQKIHDAISSLIKSGVMVIESPQTVYGRICLNVYSDQREAQKIGVLGNLSDMTTETAYIKLSWLLSNYKKEEVKELIGKNLRGEIAESIDAKSFLY